MPIYTYIILFEKNSRKLHYINTKLKKILKIYYLLGKSMEELKMGKQMLLKYLGSSHSIMNSHP